VPTNLWPVRRSPACEPQKPGGNFTGGVDHADLAHIVDLASGNAVSDPEVITWYFGWDFAGDHAIKAFTDLGEFWALAVSLVPGISDAGDGLFRLIADFSSRSNSFPSIYLLMHLSQHVFGINVSFPLLHLSGMCPP
jgi:hypothetical protein